MTPEQIVTFGAGAVALALILWFVRGILNLTIRKQESNAAGEETLNRRLQKQIDDLNSRNFILTDRMHEIMRDSITLATTHGSKLMESVQQVRLETHDSITRLHKKVEITQSALDECKEQHKDCAQRLETLEQKVG